MTPEVKVKNMIKKELNKINCFYFFPVANMYTKVGIPDIIGCYKGKFFAIEVKKENYKKSDVRLKQIQLLNEIKENGGISLIISNEEELNNFIKELTNE